MASDLPAAWSSAVAVVRGLHGDVLEPDELDLLNRPVADDHAAQVRCAWDLIAPCCKAPADEVHVVFTVIEAWRLADAAPDLPAIKAQAMKDLEKLRPASPLLELLDNVLPRWAADPAEMIGALDEPLQRLRLTRKTGASTVRKSVFVQTLSEGLEMMFGEPLDAAVAALATVALAAPEAIEPAYVRSVRRGAARRSAARSSSK